MKMKPGPPKPAICSVWNCSACWLCKLEASLFMVSRARTLKLRRMPGWLRCSNIGGRWSLCRTIWKTGNSRWFLCRFYSKGMAMAAFQTVLGIFAILQAYPFGFPSPFRWERQRLVCYFVRGASVRAFLHGSPLSRGVTFPGISLFLWCWNFEDFLGFCQSYDTKMSAYSFAFTIPFVLCLAVHKFFGWLKWNCDLFFGYPNCRRIVKQPWKSDENGGEESEKRALKSYLSLNKRAQT